MYLNKINPQEPAKYEFSYDVQDPESGNSFGHSESRDGDLATGQFNVLLPDGRRQVVEYEADADGFRPQIRYEGTKRGSNFQKKKKIKENNAAASSESHYRN